MKLNTSKIILSTHAYERMAERFPNVCKNKNAATNYARSLLKSVNYIGIIPDKDSKDAHMFVYENDIAIYTTLDGNMIKTVYNIDRKQPVIGLRQKFESIYQKEFRKIHRTEVSERKKLEHLTLKNEMEIAALKYRKLRTRSQNVRNECDKQIEFLMTQIRELENGIKKIQIYKREVADAIATQTY